MDVTVDVTVVMTAEGLMVGSLVAQAVTVVVPKAAVAAVGALVAAMELVAVLPVVGVMAAVSVVVAWGGLAMVTMEAHWGEGRAGSVVVFAVAATEVVAEEPLRGDTVAPRVGVHMEVGYQGVEERAAGKAVEVRRAEVEVREEGEVEEAGSGSEEVYEVG